MRTRIVAALLVSSACQTEWASGPRAGDSKAATKNASSGKSAGKKSPFGPSTPAEITAIAEFEDRRSFGDGQLLAFAANSDANVRARAMQALGRIQDAAGADALLVGLKDTEPNVRIEAGFGLGLLGLSWTPLADTAKAKIADALLEAESSESQLPVKLVLIQALGRTGVASAMERLTDRLFTDGEVQTSAALALGVAAKAGATMPPRAFPQLSALVKKDLPPATRYAAAYALALTKSPLARTPLLLAVQDDGSEVRAIAAKGLGDVGTDVDAVPLKKLIDDPDYRAAAEATRALAKLASRCKPNACPAIGALADLSLRAERLVRGDSAGGGQPLLALAQQGLPPSGKALLVSLRQQLAAGFKATQDSRTKQDIANLDCRLADALDRQTMTVTESLGCGEGLIPEPQRLATTLNDLAAAASASPVADPGKKAQELGAYIIHADPRVKAATVSLLGELKSPVAIEKVRTQLGSADPVLAGAAAAAAAKLGDKSAIPAIRALAQKALTQVDLAIPVAEALATLDAKEATGDLEPWLQSTHATIRKSAADALSKLKGISVVALRVERPVDKTKPPKLPQDARITIATQKGEFEVKFDTVNAPLTSLNIYTLARKGYFTNLTFHRVVPDFVVQGGDPRGDGEGGPGYSIRCEVNRKSYARGVVGMALSGKDTGGSQFFVTAAPQPHLDGKYTAFGEVVQGQEVVDALLEGDKIIEVRAAP